MVSTSRRRDDIIEVRDALLTCEVAETEEIHNLSLHDAFIVAERWAGMSEIGCVGLCEWLFHTVFLMSLISE